MIWIILVGIILSFLISSSIFAVIMGSVNTSSVNQIEEDDIDRKHRKLWGEIKEKENRK